MKILTSNIRPNVKIYEILIYLIIVFIYGYIGGRMFTQEECLKQRMESCQCGASK